MKRDLQPFTYLVFITFLSFSFSIAAQAQVTNYASLPYYEGFESGVLDNNWYKVSSIATGRIKIWPSDTLVWGGDTAMAFAGAKFLGMDMPTAGTYNLNEAWLGLNTVGFSGLYLSFSWSDWNDENSPEDGIYISDNGGATFTKVIDLLGENNPDLNWVSYNFNLDSINQVHGLNYGPNYVIKFQQYDNYYLGGGNDGFLFDEIAVGPVITATKAISKKAFQVYPNPVENELNILGQNVNAGLTVNIINTMGQKLSSTAFAVHEPVKLNLDLPSGVYFVEIITPKTIEVKEFIKK